MGQQETIALERGEVALDYAVCFLEYQCKDNSDQVHRTLSRQSESPTTISMRPRSCS